MADKVEQRAYARFKLHLSRMHVLDFRDFKSRFRRFFVPALQPYLKLADLGTDHIFELWILCTQFEGSDLCEDPASYFFRKLEGEDPDELTFCLYLSRLFIDLANALGEAFWKDHVPRKLTVELPVHVPRTHVKTMDLPDDVEKYLTAWDLPASSGSDESLCVPVLDKSDIEPPAIPPPVLTPVVPKVAKGPSTRKRMIKHAPACPRIGRLSFVVREEIGDGTDVCKDWRFKHRLKPASKKSKLSDPASLTLFNKFAALDCFDPG